MWAWVRLWSDRALDIHQLYLQHRIMEREWHIR